MPVLCASQMIRETAKHIEYSVLVMQSAWEAHHSSPGSGIFVCVRIRLRTILGRFSIIYVRVIGLRIKVRVWVIVSVWVRVN